MKANRSYGDPTRWWSRLDHVNLQRIRYAPKAGNVSYEELRDKAETMANDMRLCDPNSRDYLLMDRALQSILSSMRDLE